MKLKEKFKNLRAVPLICDASMAEYTTYKTGGAAQVLALPQNINQIKDLVNFADAEKINWRVMGFGSNILAGGGGIEGVVCCLKNLKGMEIRNNLLISASGEAFDNVIASAVNLGLEGLENLSGIPGSVGGAVFMNAGAYGSETFDNIISVLAMDLRGNIKTLDKTFLKPYYRRVEGLENCIILSARWQLRQAKNIETLKARRLEILRRRTQKQPLEYPSAGSVFKRPKDNFASALIDKCGLKGLRSGGAMVSEKHAGFIINYDNASPADIKNLIEEVQKKVFEKTGVKLELEQILWGKF
ncbi:MAG: UDP-N-acetylmuramate dehydrogenase [Elusimicrobiota bacterium]|jgi:UDP-N-acetylmuramate dehydrogenase|nr:UDP-N-acetylmuramate dehydrogenase [Elusimicrobiota bacterium]